MKLFLYSLLVALCLSLPLWSKPITTTARDANAGASRGTDAMPKQCRPGKTSSAALGWRWKPGTLVKVYYLKDNFGPAEAEALSRAVKGWDDALREINSDVALVVSGEREEVSRTDASVTVLRGIPRGKERLGEIRFYSLSTGVVRMTVTINPVVTDPEALTSLLTHELGHSFGLADCYRCRRGTTAMAAFKSDNKGNDVYEPSACDKYAVAAGYAGGNGTQEARAVVEQ